jgi:protein TonB
MSRFISILILVFVISLSAFAQDHSSQPPRKLKDSIDGQVIWDSALTQPEFPGGQNAMNEYIGTHLHYPATERENGVQGTIVLTFIIDKKGRIRNVKVVKSVKGGTSLAVEAVRMVKEMPQWVPGKTYGMTENVMFTLPVVFKIK